MTTPVTRTLDTLSIPYRYFHHPAPPRTLEQAAEERGQRPEQIVRSILFRLSGGEFVMVLMPGPAQISWTALRRHLGVRRVTTAKPEEVLAVTGYETGAVSPFGLPRPVRVLVDKGVCRQDEISIGAGVRGATVIMRRADLMRALEAALGEVEMGAFCEEC
jgi:Cys-tRNA(Pro) deacylase